MGVYAAFIRCALSDNQAYPAIALVVTTFDFLLPINDNNCG